MDDKTTQTETVQDNPTPAHPLMPQNETSDVSVMELAQLIDSERDAQGIEALPLPKKIGESIAERFPPLSPDEAAALDRRAEEFQRYEIDRRRRDSVARLIEGAGPAFADKTLDSFVASIASQRSVVNELRKYITTIDQEIRAGRGLVLFGPCGTGKDHLLFSVAMVAAELGVNVSWINGQDWFGEIRDDMDAASGLTERQRIARAARERLLVISDPLPPFGSLSQHMSTMLYRLMNDRIELGRPTFVSINVENDAEAKRRLGTATWERICDNAWKMLCNWPSYRNPYRKVNC